MMRKLALTFVLLVFGASSQTVLATEIIGLNEVVGATTTGGTEATDVSSDGSVVVGRLNGPYGRQAFRWTSATGAVGIGDLNGGPLYSTEATGVSQDGGVIVGEDSSGSSQRAFLWTAAGGMINLGLLSGSTGYSTATNVSGNGESVVGYGWTGSAHQAFRWSASTGMQGLGYLPGDTRSEAYDVSGDGSVVVGSGNEQAFRWTSSSGMTPLGWLAGDTTSVARAISLDGSTVVGVSGSQAFRWTDTLGIVSLNIGSPFPSAHAYGVSDDGTYIVGEANSSEAFLWDEGNGIRLISDILTERGVDLTGWTLTRANAVSADGLTIVGWGSGPAAGGSTIEAQAWIAIIPEPTTALLLGIGLIGLAMKRRTHA